VDPTATPWRALEDPAEPATRKVAPAARATVPRSAVAIGGGAALLSLLAFLLAFGTGSGGTVVVDGGAPLGSAATVAAGASGLDPAVGSGGRELVVEIVGAVDRPGVFRLPPDSRVGDLVKAAGGYGTRVDASRASRELNLAAPLHDGEQIRVPSRDDAASADPHAVPIGGAPEPNSAGDGPLDLNRATSAELEELPGIGPVTADKILGSREEQPFRAVEDLRTRKLVGEKTFAKLKDLVMVR
jgi:competence protein ComEA